MLGARTDTKGLSYPLREGGAAGGRVVGGDVRLVIAMLTFYVTITRCCRGRGVPRNKRGSGAGGQRTL